MSDVDLANDMVVSAGVGIAGGLATALGAYFRGHDIYEEAATMFVGLITTRAIAALINHYCVSGPPLFQKMIMTQGSNIGFLLTLIAFNWGACRVGEAIMQTEEIQEIECRSILLDEAVALIGCRVGTHAMAVGVGLVASCYTGVSKIMSSIGQFNTRSTVLQKTASVDKNDDLVELTSSTNKFNDYYTF